MRLRAVSALRALLISSAFLLAGCPTPEDKECQTAQNCNQLGTQTVSQCSSNADSCQSELRQGNSSCAALADAIDAYDNCESSQSCSDRQSTNPTNGPCATYFSNLAGAAVTAAINGCPACGQTSDAGH
jgi:hypothetical protein